MTDQKLVDELEKALTDEAYDGGMGALSAEEFSELVRTLAVTAAEVVERAHTPTEPNAEEEPEWEWATSDDRSMYVTTSEAKARQWMGAGLAVARRRAADPHSPRDPWVPVKQEGAET